jgi:hypothetical protein
MQRSKAMRIIISPNALPRLEAPNDFDRFSVAIDPSLSKDRRLAVAPIADLDGEGMHAWVRPDAIRALSLLGGQPTWEAGFARMMRFAAQHDFLDEKGHIRAHIETLEDQPAIEAEVFRQAMRRFASGICVVAAGEGDVRQGMTVSAFSSVSAEPPMILVCINRSSSAHETLTTSSRFSVNILGDGQEEYAMVFAGQRGLKGADRFDENWQNHDVAGSHTVMIGRVIDAVTNRPDGGSALINYDGQMRHRFCAASVKGYSRVACR